MLEDPHARAFVIFLDVNHVEVEASHRIRRPLIDALERNDRRRRSRGGDDARDVGRRSDVRPQNGHDRGVAHAPLELGRARAAELEGSGRGSVPGVLPRHRSHAPVSGRRSRRRCGDDRASSRKADARRDGRSRPLSPRRSRGTQGSHRRQRRMAPAAAEPRLARQLYCQVPGANVYVDPRSGKPTTKAPATNPTGVSPDVCDRDRMALAALDDEQQFRQILDEANRANTSFYPSTRAAWSCSTRRSSP